MGLRFFLLGLASGMILLGCAGASFNYKYYALDAASYKGFLRGPDPKDDLDLEKECAPTPANVAPCTVFKTDVALRLKLEYKDLQNKLKSCEADKGRVGH